MSRDEQHAGENPQENIRVLPDLNETKLFQEKLLDWFEKNGREFPWRRGSTSNYEVIIAELLLQRTRAETVAPFFQKFIQEFPTWEKLASASELQLQTYLRPVGLWRRRAASMRELAKVIVKTRGHFPSDREKIEALPGVGQYIANSVLLFHFSSPEPLLDVNMARVLERVYGPRQLSDIRYDPHLQSLAKQTVMCKRSKEINWAILDLAAQVCVIRSPRCELCPLSALCLDFAKRA